LLCFAFISALRARNVCAPSPSFITDASGVGQPEDEDAFALVRRADLRRAEQSCLNREAQLAKVSPYPLGSSDFVSPRREHAGDVLDEDEPRPGAGDDAPRVAPEVAFVEAAALAAGEAVRLARDAANEAINEAAPWAAVEGADIRPDRRRSQETRVHRRDQMGNGEGFPLHHNDGARSRNGEVEGKVEPSASGAEADDVEAGSGTKSHIHAAPPAKTYTRIAQTFLTLAAMLCRTYVLKRGDER
jgi:hypothetical protein